MSKKMKCPNCGATVPADVKYCRKCHARLDSGRIENLSKPGRRSDDDALRNLPRPVRPSAEQQPAQQPRGDGFFAPEQGGGESVEREAAPERMGRMGPASDRGPRPTETARGGDIPGYSGRQTPRNLWQIVAVLALILVVIVVAVVLVIKLNQPAEQGGTPNPSEPFTGVHVIDPDGATPSPDPNGELLSPPEDNEPPAVPTATPTVTATPIPSPTPMVTPTPAPSSTPNPYNITGINDTVYISGNGVNIRSGPGTSYQILGNESAGYELQRTGRTDNGWSRVYYKGAEAYVIDTLITSTKPASTSPSYTVTEASGTVTVTSDANLRTGPGTNYDVVTVAKTGTQLTRTGVTGNWTRVQYDGKEVFISSGLINQSGGGTSAPQSSQVIINGIGVNVRTGPGTEYSRVGSVSTGDKLPYVGESGNWYQVTYNGQTCYVSKDYAKLG